MKDEEIKEKAGGKHIALLPHELGQGKHREDGPFGTDVYVNHRCPYCDFRIATRLGKSSSEFNIIA